MLKQFLFKEVPEAIKTFVMLFVCLVTIIFSWYINLPVSVCLVFGFLTGFLVNAVFDVIGSCCSKYISRHAVYRKKKKKKGSK